MKVLLFLFALGLSIAAVAQETLPASLNPASPSWMPHPIAFIGPSLLGNGYQTLAGSLGGGFLLNSSRLLGDSEAYYMNARKTNDGTVNNNKGRERSLEGRLFYRWRRGMYFGGGVQWSETATTNYAKKGWRPAFGMGADHFAKAVSYRWQVLYVTKGTDKTNGLQGPEVQLWLPSPVSRSHFFYRQTLGIYEFHTTITEPSDRELTAQQANQRSTASFLDFTLGWKF